MNELFSWIYIGQFKCNRFKNAIRYFSNFFEI